MARPGGNPEFGKSIKQQQLGSEPLSKVLTIRVTETCWKELEETGDYKNFIREAIAEKLKREKSQ